MGLGNYETLIFGVIMKHPFNYYKYDFNKLKSIMNFTSYKCYNLLHVEGLNKSYRCIKYNYTKKGELNRLKITPVYQNYVLDWPDPANVFLMVK